MAKQSGIHQLRGKVGEMSYYRTKGVNDGVARRINQGMSQRVKTGDEYANTRLNNAEFKNANAIATAAFNSVNSRKRGMMRNFAVAEMTKRALEDIKQGEQAWGVRMPVTELDQLICDMLENYAKGGKYNGEYGVITDTSLGSDGVFSVGITIDTQLAQSLKSLGIDRLLFVPSKALAGEIVVDGLPRLFSGMAIGGPAPVVLNVSEETKVTITGSLSTPTSVGMSPSGYEFAKSDPKHGFYSVISILPARVVGSQVYTMQELCTFVAVPLGQISE